MLFAARYTRFLNDSTLRSLWLVIIDVTVPPPCRVVFSPFGKWTLQVAARLQFDNANGQKICLAEWEKGRGDIKLSFISHFSVDGFS